MPESWPFTGRGEELSAVGSLLRGGAGDGAVLAGEAGVGKSRLAREALAVADRAGAATRWVTATTSAQALPLGAFAGVVGAVGSDPSDMLRRATAALLRDCGRTPLVLGVDDGHLLDELSAILVHHLVVHHGVAVVMTLRTGEPVTDAVRALWKDGHLRRLEVRPLSQQDTGRLLEAACGGQLTGAAVRRMWSITAGNPLYLRELVEGEQLAERLRPDAGVWQWEGPPRLTPSLVELIEERVGTLSDAQRDVIDVLAIGEPLSVPLLAGLTDPAAVEQVETRGLVTVTSQGRWLEARLAHPLYGEVARARCGRLRARRLRGRVAGALATTGGRRAGDDLRRAALAVDSDLPPDPDLLARAAQRALELADCALAERLARAAVAAGGGFEPQLTLGYAMGMGGRGEAAEAELVWLTDVATTDHERAQIAVCRAGTLTWLLARPDDAAQVLSDVRSAVTDEVSRLELDAIGAAVDAYQGRTPAAASAAQQVLAHPRRSDDATVLASWALVTTRAGLGRVAELEEIVGRAERARGSARLGLVRVGSTGDMWVRALRLAGELETAETVVRSYVDRTRDGTDPLRAMLTMSAGQVARDRGQVRTAVRRFREAAGGLDRRWVYYLRVALAQALAMTGDARAAEAALAAARDVRDAGWLVIQPDLEIAEAWVAAAAGVVGRAVPAARRAAATAVEQAQPAVEVVALHTAVQLGDRTVADRLAELAAQVDGPRAGAAAAHAAALAADDAAALLAVSDRLERMGALLLAADAAAQAAGAYAGQGRRASAGTAAARAHRLADTCENARTPALAAITRPLPLTDREREIVALVAAGLANRAIADRLVVSVRTVENHIYRACSKLGVANREELTALTGN